MSNDELFNNAFSFIMRWEGGESVHKDDLGGYTMFGISQVHHPEIDVKGLTRDKAKLVYQHQYWPNTPGLRNCERFFLFDAAVNMGKRSAGILFQKACRATPDGSIGKETVAKSMLLDPIEMITKFHQLRVDYYLLRCKQVPSQDVFLRGWLRRTMACALAASSVAWTDLSDVLKKKG